MQSIFSKANSYYSVEISLNHGLLQIAQSYLRISISGFVSYMNVIPRRICLSQPTFTSLRSARSLSSDKPGPSKQQQVMFFPENYLCVGLKLLFNIYD